VSIQTEEQEQPCASAPESIYAYRVSQRVLPAVWRQCAPLLEKGLPRVRGWFTLGTIKDRLLVDYYQLWVATEHGRVLAALLTEIHKTPSGKLVLEVPLAAGSRARDWFGPMLASVAEYAHLRGVTELKFTGRYGWWRYLKRHGFQPEATVFYREEV
jgi:hypothetical protein